MALNCDVEVGTEHVSHSAVSCIAMLLQESTVRNLQQTACLTAGSLHTAMWLPWGQTSSCLSLVPVCGI